MEDRFQGDSGRGRYLPWPRPPQTAPPDTQCYPRSIHSLLANFEAVHVFRWLPADIHSGNLGQCRPHLQCLQYRFDGAAWSSESEGNAAIRLIVGVAGYTVQPGLFASEGTKANTLHSAVDYTSGGHFYVHVAMATLR